MRQHIDNFLETLQRFYEEQGRHDMSWRQPQPDGSFDPYKILVSELMLQQTQVSRVEPKYAAFLRAFPTAGALAGAPLGDVLVLWSGLGYNRRAKFLWQAARYVTQVCGGDFPRTLAGLQRLPGVGPNTAGAIMAYAFNEPVIYVETNIRTVIIHHFFADADSVTDAQIRDVLAAVVTGLGPREFYWAMMDYGAFLKKSVGNPNKLSASYTRQSAFHGSRRQLRGMVLRLLAERPHMGAELLRALDDERAEGVLADLLKEEMILSDGGWYRLSGP
ncbi:MAG TPA: hypothetical protein VF572_06250 [Candidatus Saccharimonadales bacterium]|jgi:A/G-specific adenine glycosylase